MIRIFILSLALLFCAMPAYAQDTDPNDLEALTRQQKQAEKQAGKLSKQHEQVQGEISDLRRDLVDAAARARGYEKAGNEAEARLTDLQTQERELKTVILADHTALTDTLAALQRIERNPPPALLVNSSNAVDSVRAAKLLSYLSGELEKRSKILRARLIDLQAIKTGIDKNTEEISKNASILEGKLKNIKGILSNKSSLSSQIDKNRKKRIAEAEKLAKEAQSLRDLISKFERRAADITPRLKPKRGGTPRPHIKPNKGTHAPPPIFIPSTGGRFADTRGKLPLPVFGTLSRKFNSKLAGGGKAKGISIRSRASAQVVAPFGGRVEFSGAFNDDHVVILNVGGGYFIVLTGLGETFTKAGSIIEAGEPLGLMPSNKNRRHDLFLEFRKNRTSIDPIPWVGAALAQR